MAAIRDVVDGKADDLGGGVFKKRLSQNRQRSIVLFGGGGRWVFVYLYAKQDRASITGAELAGFRKLAKAYRGLTGPQLDGLLAAGDLKEIEDGEV